MKIDWAALGRELTTWSWMDGAKLFLSALIIVLVTKVQVVNDKLSALLIALPLTSLLAMIWMNSEKQGNERIANHAEGVAGKTSGLRVVSEAETGRTAAMLRRTGHSKERSE